MDAGVQGRESSTPLGLHRQHALFGLDAGAGGIADRALGHAGRGTDDEGLGVLGAVDGGDDIGMGGASSCGDGGFGFKLGGGEGRVALADLDGGAALASAEAGAFGGASLGMNVSFELPTNSKRRSRPDGEWLGTY
jgi:hypothetical protein